MATTENTNFAAWLGTRVEPLARIGYAINGITYIVVGVLALRAALSEGGDVEVGRDDALLFIVTAPFGPLLLTIVAIGIAGYALGHVLMAFRSRSKDKKRGIVSLVNRGAHLFAGLIHFSLALTTGRLAVTGLSNGERTPEDWTARILAEPWGSWLVLIVGLGLLGVSVYEFYKAYTANFREVFRDDTSKVDGISGTVIGRIGYTARGVSYLLIGTSILRAGWYYDAQEARGLGEAMAALANQPYFGAWLLGAIAVGLIAYGLFGVFLGKHRDFNF